MGQSKDILITPYFSSKTKTLEYRYRKNFRNGDMTFNGAFSDDDLASKDLRYFSKMVGYFKLGYGVDLNFDIGKVGDNSYLGDYAYYDESDFKSEISLGKVVVEREQFFEGYLRYLREKEKFNSLDEYYSFSGLYARNVYLPILPRKLRLSANLNSAFNVNDDKSVSRPPSSAQVKIDYYQLNSAGPIEFVTDSFANINSFVNSADAGTTNEEFSLQYGLTTSISAPHVIKGKGKVGLLRPQISLSFNGQENDISGEYFIGSDELSWGNIYRGKKISSLTETETDFSVSFGLEHKVYWQTGEQLEISLAASKIGGLTYNPTLTSGLTTGKLNYLGRFSYQSNQDSSVAAEALFSSARQLLKSTIRSKQTIEKFDLSLDYKFIDQAMDSRLSTDLKTIGFLSSYNFVDNWKLSAGGRYDFMYEQMAKTSFGLGFSLGLWNYEVRQENLKEEIDKLSLSAIYDDECTRLIFSFENRYQDLGSSEPIKSLMFRVQLKPFANVVFSKGDDQITF